MYGAGLHRVPGLTVLVLSVGSSITAGMDGTWEGRQQKAYVGAALMYRLHRRSQVI